MFRLSIITITFNSEKTVEETFKSVLCQKHRPLQYVVVDGLSTDGTVGLIRKYEPEFKSEGIEFSFVSEKDKGISDAFNKGIGLADGDLIGIINSDDKLCGYAAEVLQEAYDINVDVYYGKCIVFNNGNDKQYIVEPKDNLRLLYKCMPLCHPAVFVKKDAYKKYGLFDIELRYCMDRELLLRFFDAGARFLHIDRELAYYREGGVNQVNYKKTLKEEAIVSVMYGMNPVRAEIFRHYKYLRFLAWRFIQKTGCEKFIHKPYGE